MKQEPAFWTWVGYLCNPHRRMEIHAEMHPNKEEKFREDYFNRTQDKILLPGNTTPFYVWGEGADKYGIQLRVYFNGDRKYTPNTSDLFNVTAGRTSTTLRVNSKNFVLDLFSTGFRLGKNLDCYEKISATVPPKFATDFNRGFDMQSPLEEMEMLVINYYKQNGKLMEQGKNLEKLHTGKNTNPSALLDELCKNKILTKNNKSNSYALLDIQLLRGEIENKSLRNAIDLERDNAKRELLMENYVRDRGWIRLARSTFGDVCMFNKCNNTFLKDNGDRYIETHHIKPLSDGGKDHIRNLIMLCAHHHRMAHFSTQRERAKLSAQFQRQNTVVLTRLGI